MALVGMGRFGLCWKHVGKASLPNLNPCSRLPVMAVQGMGDIWSSRLNSQGAKFTPLDNRLYQYILEHTREPPILSELRKETAPMNGSGMQVPPDQGQFLALLVQLMGAEKCIELGVFTGYSALAVALALPDWGRLVACEISEESITVAKKYFERAGVGHKVDVRLGLAVDTLNKLLLDNDAGRYDFAFLDADKGMYRTYYELLLKLLRPGGLIVVDNVLWYGSVADPLDTEKRTQLIRDLNDFIFVDDRVSVSLVPIGDGLTLCRKL